METIASSPYAFWVVAALIVLLDSATLLAPGEFAFDFDRQGRPRLRIPATPFLLRNKDLIFACLSYFARPFFVSSITAPQTIGEVRELAARAARGRAMCAYSYVTAAMVVAVGPVVSVQAGISLALLIVLPVLYLNSIVTLLAVFVSRADFDLSPRQLAYLAFEFLVCPVLVVNLNKRLGDKARVVANTRELAQGDQNLLRRVNANLELTEDR